jgi:hypothetical protein
MLALLPISIFVEYHPKRSIWLFLNVYDTVFQLLEAYTNFLEDTVAGGGGSFFQVVEWKQASPH